MTDASVRVEDRTGGGGVGRRGEGGRKSSRLAEVLAEPSPRWKTWHTHPPPPPPPRCGLMPLNHPPLTQAAMPSWQRGGRCFCWHGDGPLLERRGGLPPTPGQDGAAADATLGDIASLQQTATGVLSPKNVSVGRFLDLKKIAFRQNSRLLCSVDHASELVPRASLSPFTRSRQTQTLLTKRSKAIFGEWLIWMIRGPRCQHFPNLCLRRGSSIHAEDFWIILRSWNTGAGLKTPHLQRAPLVAGLQVLLWQQRSAGYYRNLPAGTAAT